MSAARTLWALACACVLAACATRPPAVPAPEALAPADQAQAEALQAGRVQALAGITAWSLDGRASITRGNRGGSGRLEWRQDGAAFVVELAAPVTRQGWRLSVDAGGALLEGLDGGPRSGPDGQVLLLEATGLDVPVAALGAWLRGLAADGPAHGPARLAYGPDLLPARLEQAGWTIDFRAWHPPAAGLPALPRRIDASRADAGVRLVVDRWGGGTP